MRNRFVAVSGAIMFAWLSCLATYVLLVAIAFMVGLATNSSMAGLFVAIAFMPFLADRMCRLIEKVDRCFGARFFSP